MTVNWRVLIEPQYLGNAAASLYSPTSKSTGLIKKITVTNQDTVSHQVTVYIVPSGQSAGVTYAIYNAVNVPPQSVNGGILELFGLEGSELAPGDALFAFADAANHVTIYASGAEQF